jgi:hypothetical protein
MHSQEPLVEGAAPQILPDDQVHNISPPPGTAGAVPAGPMDVDYANQIVSVENRTPIPPPCDPSRNAESRRLEVELLTLLLSLSSFPYAFADEAFAAKHLSDMGEEVDDFQVFTWPLSDYRRMDKKSLSPEFSCGGHKW